MAITPTVIEDTPEFTGYEDYDDATGTVRYRRVWKAGTASANREELRAKLVQARALFRGNYTNWGSMTAAQKDAANRQAQRALANLIAVALDEVADTGD
jgi:hypothetical protein